MVIDSHAHVTAPDALYVYKAGLSAHRGAHGRGSIRIEHDTADDASRRLRLRVQRPDRGTARQRKRSQHDRDGPMQGSEHEGSASWGDVHV